LAESLLKAPDESPGVASVCGLEQRRVCASVGPGAVLDLIDALVAEPSLKSYHLLPAVRGDLLRKLGRSEEARAEFERAASLTENLRERELLQKRAAEMRRRANQPARRT
jgi:predicted RNA polymerase sigma factor